MMTTKGDLTDFMFLATPYSAADLLLNFFSTCTHSSDILQQGLQNRTIVFGSEATIAHRKAMTVSGLMYDMNAPNQSCSTDQKLDAIRHHYASR